MTDVSICTKNDLVLALMRMKAARGLDYAKAFAAALTGNRKPHDISSNDERRMLVRAIDFALAENSPGNDPAVFETDNPLELDRYVEDDLGDAGGFIVGILRRRSGLMYEIQPDGVDPVTRGPYPTFWLDEDRVFIKDD